MLVHKAIFIEVNIIVKQYNAACRLHK